MGRPTRVLHVDDDPDFAELAATSIGRSHDDLEVIVETDPDDALDRLDDPVAAIDCVVSDYEMPETDGIEFLEAVRADDPELPFVLFTGKGSEEVARDAFSKGATDYLQKETGLEQFELLAKRIENAVSRRRARTDYRRIFEDATDGIVVSDPDTHGILDANRRFCEMLGYDRETIEGTSITEFGAAAPDEPMERIRERIESADGDGSEVFEWQVETADGVELPVEVRSKRTTLRGRDCVLAFTRDVSERKARERDLKQERAFVESLFDAIPDVVYALDETGTIIRWNDRATEVTGYTDAEVRAMDALDFFDGEDVQRVASAIETVLTEQRSASVEADFVTKDGTTVPYEFIGAPLIDEGGNVRGVVGAGRDLSERKSRQRQLRRYEQIVHTVGDAVFELDGEGYLVELNDYMADILDYEAEELVGTHFSSFTSADDLETAMDAYKQLMTGESEYVTFEVLAETADGESIPCEVRSTLAPERNDASQRGTVSVVRNVSDRKERQRELRRQNRRLEEFASIVSHDLKNPLGVAKGRIQLAREDHDSEDLAAAASSLDRMESIIDRTLTLARKGRTVGETHAVDPTAVAEDAWATAGDPEAILRLRDVPELEADPNRLRHLFENLFGNAVDHGGHDVTVTVGSLDGGGFYVADDGEGLSDEARERVLEAGYTTSEEGTGLGLAIVRRIAEAHGWTLDVTESECGGARFEFIGLDPVDRDA